MTRKSSLVDERLAKALSHPLRARILAILDERVASPNEISELVGERLPNVSYHVRALVDLGCIELVDTAQRRGAIEHYYRALKRPFFSDADWSKLPASARQSVADRTIQAVWADLSDAITVGTLEKRLDRRLTSTELQLDEQAWEDLTQAVANLAERAERIQAQAATRLAKTDETAFPARLVLMAYEAARED